MHKRSFLIAAGAHFAVLSFISHIPGDALAPVGFPGLDKLAHLVAYIPLGIFLWRGLPGKEMSIAKVFLFSGMAASLGALDEFHQSFVPGRFASLWVFVADFVGSTTGAAISALLKSGSGR
jgi:VanZ family protein